MLSVAQTKRCAAVALDSRTARATARVFLLIGPPGCGKGTQARILTQKLGIPSISTGEILRMHASAETETGRKLRRIMEAGDLVSDEVVNEAVAHRIAERDCEDGFILDGYPRTAAQAEFLSRALANAGFAEPMVLVFDVLPDLLVRRLTARRYCPLCGRIYNLVSAPPADEEFCDDDGMCLVKRDDDDERVIRERFVAYESATAPLLRRYRGRLFRLDAAAEMDDVAEQIEAALNPRA